MKVESIAAILLTCIMAIIGLESQFSVFLRVVVLHRFYCIYIFAAIKFQGFPTLLHLVSGALSFGDNLVIRSTNTMPAISQEKMSSEFVIRSC